MTDDKPQYELFKNLHRLLLHEQDNHKGNVLIKLLQFF